jgi:predicted  nucleic acid-binding Zn-ribbon protein
MERRYAMNNSDVDQLLSNFLDGVETLLHRYESLREEKNQMKERIDELQETIDTLKEKNQRLESKIDSQRLEFSELAGSLESRLNRIKEEASELLPENEQ